MPLLKKSLKTNLSQTKKFKAPYSNHKDKIRDLIDNKLNEPETKKAYKSFIRKLSQEKYENRASSPKMIQIAIEENQTNCPSSKTKKTEKEIKQKKRNTEGFQKCISFSTDDESLSQEELNSEKIKAAYVDFMNNSVAEEKKHKKKTALEKLADEILDVSRNLSKNISNESGSMTNIKNGISNKIADSVKMVSKKSTKKENVFKSKSKENLATKRSRKLKSTKKEKSQSEPDPQSEESFSEFSGLTIEEKMEKIYEGRNVGLYAICDSCDKHRYLPHIVDPLDLPDKWYCFMNPDRKHNKCEDPELVEEDEEFLIHNLYNTGSVVFAQMDGYPWWPAMVDDDPDTETYYWIEGDSNKPVYYNVTFFDSAAVTRTWVRPARLKPFKKNMNEPPFTHPAEKKYKARLQVAFEQAIHATELPLPERLKTYGFIKRFTKRGRRVAPKKRKEKSRKVNMKRRQASLSSVDSISSILGDGNLFDLSFNFLDRIA